MSVLTTKAAAHPGAHPGANPGANRMPELVLGALGIVFGDIGTSPLYTLRECFSEDIGLSVTPGNVLGVLSLIFWALILVVTIKYVLFVMLADNRGEGGIFSLMALATDRQPATAAGRLTPLLALGIIGAGLFYGDGMITPAISVLSAMEGLELARPGMQTMVVPLTSIILIILFSIQSHGTAKVGALFGPIMVVWFGILAVLGLSAIAAEPGVLAALDPRYAAAFCGQQGWHIVLVLGAVVLAVTGGEALYADMGHFGRQPIRTAWFAVALPALAINYFGQGALILREPDAVRNPFFLMVPDWGLYPMILLAAMATVIASQAVISGVFSMTRQAVQLGLCPRLRVSHTSAADEGQIYVPRANWGLLLAILGLVAWFGSSTRLAGAYGIAVTGTMLITTVLALVVARRVWGWGLAVCIGIGVVFLTVDTALFAANVIKIPQGGWVPLVLSMITIVLISTWRRGRAILARRLAEASLPLDQFFRRHPRSQIHRIKGTAVFMTSNRDMVPVALLHNLKHNQVLHDRVIFLTVSVEGVSRVPAKERVIVEGLAEGFYRITVRYGFFQEPNIIKALRLCKAMGLEFDPMATSFFLGRETVMPTVHPPMALWREHLFVLMTRTAVSATDYFKLPPDRVVELGAQVQL
jgi:KUP system potassium uptake protein